MKMIDKKKDLVQQEALSAWLAASKKGTCEIITGLGKTFISLHALYTMPKDDSVHLFLAEVVDRKKDLIDDIEKYNKIFNRDVLNDYNLRFECYQTVYKWSRRYFGLVICDEIHDSLTPAYVAFYKNNSYNAIIGLSATIVRGTTYHTANGTFNKGDLIDSIAPVCYKYGLNQAYDDSTARKLNIYVLEHELDATKKSVKSGSKLKPFYQTEKVAYDYWDKEHKKSWFIEDQDLKSIKIAVTSRKRSDILYNLESKIGLIQKLLPHITTKTIIFSNSIDSLLKITPNVISSRNNAAKNNLIRYNFESNKIKTIGSFKKLKQGANLTDLDNCIIMSYYSTDKDFIQRIGRLRDNGEVGNVFIILTKETQEEVWFSKMFENITNMNLIYCKNIEECINKIK